MSEHLLQQLQDGIADIGLKVDELPLQAYLRYVELLVQWNKAYNLTAIREPEKMLAYHVLDSLSVLPLIKSNHTENRCLDIGTGAGLPGIILALARPDTQWVLLDGNNKKTRFVQQAVMILNLDNVEVVCSRIEHYAPRNKFSMIISRAFTSLSAFVACSHPLLAPEGCLLAMKGPEPADEISDLDPECFITETTSLKVPGVAARRSVVRIQAKA